MATPARRTELGIDAATDDLMGRVYRHLRSLQRHSLTLEGLGEFLFLPTVRNPRGFDEARAFDSEERLQRALEVLQSVGAIQPSGDGYRVTANQIDEGNWRVRHWA